MKQAPNHPQETSCEESIRQQLFSSAILGGIMGSYPEEDFPYYCIDKQLLKHLAYDSEEEFLQKINQKLINIIHPDDRVAIRTQILRQLGEQEEYRVSYRMLRRDTSVLWVEEVGRWASDPNGRQTILRVCLDVSAQKRAEQARLEQEALHHIALENSAVSSWRYYPDSKTICFSEWEMKNNPNFPALLPDVVEVSHALSYVKPESVEDFKELHRRVDAGESGVSSDIWFADKCPGDWWCAHVSYTTIRDSAQNILYAIGTLKNITQEMQARTDKAQMELALSSTAIALWTYDIKRGIYDGRNRGAEKIGFGGLIYGGYQAVVDGGYILPESVSDYIELHCALERGETSCTANIHFDSTKVKIEWQKITYSNIFDEMGQPVLAVAIGEDVSELMLIQARYREELRTQAVLQSQGLFGQMRVNLTQDRVEQFHMAVGVGDLKPEQSYHALLGEICLCCADEKDIASIQETLGLEHLTESIQRGEREHTIEWQYRLLDGSTRWIQTQARSYSDPGNGDIMCFLYAIDIDQEKTMKTIVERLISVEYELLGIISRCNDSLRLIRRMGAQGVKKGETELNYSDALDACSSRFLLEESREEARTALSLETVCAHLKFAASYSCSFTMELDGEQRRKKWEYAYLDERHNSILLIRSDITTLFQQQEQQQKNLQDALLQAEQASLAKSSFLSRISHEIRTPMNAIIGMATLAVQNLNDSARLSDCLAKVGVSARYLLSLINDILDMSRLENGKLSVKNQRFSFEDLMNGVNTIADELADERGISYDCRMTSSVEDYYIGDVMKLQQILINLISNAMKFTKCGGKVRLIIQQRGRKGDGNVRLRFALSDTGIGIEEDFLPKLFEPFEQSYSSYDSPYGGTGLGLAICKNLTNLLHGTISVNSIEGIGTEFTLDVPLQLCQAAKVLAWDEGRRAMNLLLGSETPLMAYDFTGKRALLVEDHSINVEVAKGLLHETGMQVEVAENGLVAIELFTLAPPSYYDVILMDIRMPVMDGLTAAKAIRQLKKSTASSIPIIAMSANVFVEDVAKSKSAGINAHLAKPIDPALLYATLQNYLMTGNQTCAARRAELEAAQVDKEAVRNKDGDTLTVVLRSLRAWGCDTAGALRRLLNDGALLVDCTAQVAKDPAFEQLGTALESGDAQVAFEAAHTLKGIAANTGLNPLLRPLTALLEPLRSGHVEGLSDLYRTLLAKRGELLEILKAYDIQTE